MGGDCRLLIPVAQTCYRHPNRETGVSCSSCGRPICPDCMTPTPVGMRCPECASQRTKVSRGVGRGRLLRQRSGDLHPDRAERGRLPRRDRQRQRWVQRRQQLAWSLDFGLYGPFVAEGEWYRLVTGGFLHASLFHLGFNMFALYFLGRLLEPSIGTPRFLAVYVASLFGGAFGALILDPDALTVGASGAIFGIFGATFVIARGRGFDSVASSIGVILLINLALSFGSSSISLGGHLGGLVAGVVCALAILAGERGMLGVRHFPAEMAVMVAVTVVSIVGALTIA